MSTLTLSKSYSEGRRPSRSPAREQAPLHPLFVFFVSSGVRASCMREYGAIRFADDTIGAPKLLRLRLNNFVRRLRTEIRSPCYTFLERCNKSGF
ncbi:MAG: hypothetical protein H7A37_08660 [Chlamydiales bacterium]|nr:hypothetical protein [Chlamydiales bacterium]